MVLHSMNELLAYIRRGVPIRPTPSLHSEQEQISIARGMKALFYKEYNCYIIPAEFPPLSPIYSQPQSAPYNALIGSFENEIIQAICDYISIYGSKKINDPDYYGITALYYSVQKRYIHTASLLLKYIGNLTATTLQTLNNALISAAANNDSQMIQLLLEHCAQANVADVFGCTPLMSLARFNNQNMIHLLIQRGATVDWAIWDILMKDKISFSTINFIKETIKKTEQSSVSNSPTFLGMSLSWTLKQIENNMTIDQLLEYIQCGPQLSSQPTIKDHYLESSQDELEYELNESSKKSSLRTTKLKYEQKTRPSHEIFIKQIASLGFAIAEVEVEEIEVEVDSDCELSGSDYEISESEANSIDLNQSPQSEKEVLSAVLHYLNNKKHNNNIDKSDKNGCSLLLWAVRKGYLCVAELLLEVGKASPNIRSAQGEPALVWAAASNNLKMVELLLQYNANVNEKDTYNQSALTWATRLGNKAMTHCLVIEHDAAIEDWSVWEEQMEDYPYALGLHTSYTPTVNRAFLEAAFQTQQQKHTTPSALPDEPLSYLLERGSSFTPMANAAFPENTKRPTLSVHIDNSDERISSYIYNTPVAKATATK